MGEIFPPKFANFLLRDPRSMLDDNTFPFPFDQNRMFFCDDCFQSANLTIIINVCSNGFSVTELKQLRVLITS